MMTKIENKILARAPAPLALPKFKIPFKDKITLTLLVGGIFLMVGVSFYVWITARM